MTPQRAIKYLILGIIAIYALKLVVGRFVVFGKGYADSSREYNTYYIQNEACLEDQNTYRKFVTECEFAAKKLSHWPIMVAFGIVAAETHSCVEFPCTDLVTLLMESWTAKLFVSFTALFVFLYLIGTSWTLPDKLTKFFKPKKKKLKNFFPDESNALYYERDPLYLPAPHNTSDLRSRSQPLIEVVC